MLHIMTCNDNFSVSYINESEDSSNDDNDADFPKRKNENF